MDGDQRLILGVVTLLACMILESSGWAQVGARPKPTLTPAVRTAPSTSQKAAPPRTQLPPQPKITTPAQATATTLQQNAQANPPAKTPTQPPPAFHMKWVDARGNLLSGGAVGRIQWVWSRATETDSFDSPALRAWITTNLPADWRAKTVSGDAVTIIEPFKQGKPQNMVVDLRATHSSIRFQFEDSKGRLSEMSLVIQVSVDRPYVLVSPDCARHDIFLQPKRSQAHHLYVGLGCTDAGDRYEIRFFRSRDARWNEGPELIRFDAENKYLALKYSAPKPKDRVVYSKRLFAVGLKDDQGGAGEYAVLYNPRQPPNRLYIALGVGGTVYSYKEHNGTLRTAYDVKLSQTALTGKVNVGYRLVPRILDVAMNAFATLTPITHSSTISPNPGVAEPLPSARFYGLNGRFGYRLPLAIGATEFMFLTGWYFWSMSVPDNVYGVTQLGGPQLFLSMVNSQTATRGWSIYVKFAMISDSFTITRLSNREVAIGGSYELSSADKRPLSLTLDIADARFGLSTADQTMELLSVTLGIQKAIY